MNRCGVLGMLWLGVTLLWEYCNFILNSYFHCYIYGLWFLAQMSDSSLSADGCPLTCMEPFTVRRLSCRSVQLPPLAFRQAEQYYCERRPETETSQPRPTSLPLRAPPLIAITSAENSRYAVESLFTSPLFRYLTGTLYLFYPLP